MQEKNQNFLKKCSSEQLAKWIDFLAGQIGPRPYSNPEKLLRLAKTIRQYVAALGYDVELQKFFYKKQEYFNVVAGPKGSNPLQRSSSPILVAGAHYDTVASTPGADDNASAVAGLLEIARIFSPEPPPSLRLVWFCLEEPPAYRTRNMGSYHYASHLKRNAQEVLGMICLEMIGYFSERPGSQQYPLPFMSRIYPSAGNFIALAGNTRSRDFTMEVKRAFKLGTDLPVESINAPCLVIGIDFSDHWSFYKMGYKAVMVTDTAFYRNPNYHRPTDLPSTLDFKKAAKVVDGLVSVITRLARKPDSRN